MYERFTDRARKVMQLANQEAQRLNHEYIGTEHILLGLVKEGGGAAVNVLRYLGVEPERVIVEVEKTVRHGYPGAAIEKPPRTPRAKYVIEYAMQEARDLGHAYVGTEHILLGLLREDEAFAAQVLMNLGLRLVDVREEIRTTLQGFKDGGAFEPASQPGDKSVLSPTPLDDATKRRVRQLAEQLAPLQQAKEDAVARAAFDEAARLRDQQDTYWTELRNLDLPEWVSWNVKRTSDVWARRHSRFPVLDLLREEAGEPDASVLSLLPNPIMPPAKIVVATIPSFPVSTLKAVMGLDDIGSPYFEALVPLVSPESIAGHKDQGMMMRAAFNEIRRATGRPSSSFYNPVLICAVRPTMLPQEVQDEVCAGIHRTRCDFVVFETGDGARTILGSLPSGTVLLEA